MRPDQVFEAIAVDTLLEKVGGLRSHGYRLVQICATHLAEQVELTYSFDLNGHLTNLRLHLSATEPHVPSISSIYWCAFLYENEIHDLFKVQVDGLAVDFHGNLYQTIVKFPFGTARPPVVKRSPPSTSASSQKSNGVTGTVSTTGIPPAP